MKKVLLTVCMLCLALTMLFAGCANNSLDVPANVDVKVQGRWMTVSWDAVENADGYVIYTTSTGCNVGNRIINTATEAVTTHSNEAVTTKYPDNGSVEFLNATSVRIWLMLAADSTTELMATAVSAKVKAITNSDEYSDSDYSKVKTIAKSAFSA